MTPLETALAYIAVGRAPVPIPFKSKAPTLAKWPTLRITAKTASTYFNGQPSNIGVILGPASDGLTDTDLDCAQAIVAGRYILPPDAARFGRASKRISHYLYRTGLAEAAGKAAIQFKDPIDQKMLLELRVGGHAGAQTVFPGSVHTFGEPIEWESGCDVEPPRVDDDTLLRRAELTAAIALLAKHWPPAPGHGARHNARLAVAGVFARAGLKQHESELLADALAQAIGDEDAKDFKAAIQTSFVRHANGQPFTGLLTLSEAFGDKVARKTAEWLRYEPATAEAVPDAGAGAADKQKTERDTCVSPAFSDDMLALRFAERHAGDLRYVAAWGKWLSWTGTHWQFDDTLHAFDLARKICREAAVECNKPKDQGQLASAKTVAAVERLAKADRRIAASVEQWDSDSWLLNTPGGVIDLRTGLPRAHSPNDHMTKLAAVAPGGACPRFLTFLARITGGDAELIAYLRRVLGYALTGETREHALFFAYGVGANGKSVLLSTVSGILGKYHCTAPIETFVAGNNERHPTDLAGLRGARLVTATETDEGRPWAESRVKQLTGGDPVSARFMRQDFFEYSPQFKLLIAGNHKPSLRSVDEAIRRRFHMIPFAVTIPAAERDLELTDKLKDEWPGILQWLIDGCLEWQRDGLRPPKAVRDATTAYLEAEDALAAFLDERCERNSSEWESLAAIFTSWSVWAERAGEHRGTRKRFVQTLESKGFCRHKKTLGQGFDGIKLKS